MVIDVLAGPCHASVSCRVFHRANSLIRRAAFEMRRECEHWLESLRLGMACPAPDTRRAGMIV